MPTSKTWNNTVRSIPDAGDLNWASLSNFLKDLADNAQTTNFQKFGIRRATTSPVTVSAATDCVVVTDLSVAGAVTVNLPAGVSGQLFVIVDGKGDADTNNITIDANAAETINGSATYVMDTNFGGVVLAYDGSGWRVIAQFLTSQNPLTVGATLTEGLLTQDATSGNKTIDSGKTLTYPSMNLQSGHTYTVNGTLYAPQGVSGSGSLAGSGSVIG